MVGNACWISNANTSLSKLVHALSKIQRPHHSSTDYGYDDMLDFDTAVAWASPPIQRIHPGVAAEWKIH